MLFAKYAQVIIGGQRLAGRWQQVDTAHFSQFFIWFIGNYRFKYPGVFGDLSPVAPWFNFF